MQSDTATRDSGLPYSGPEAAAQTHSVTSEEHEDLRGRVSLFPAALGLPGQTRSNPNGPWQTKEIKEQ